MLDLDRVSEVMLYLPAGDGAAMHLIHEYGRAREIRYDDGGVWVAAELPRSIQRKLQQYIRRLQPDSEAAAALI